MADNDIGGYSYGFRDGNLPDPFNDLASRAIPRTNPDALRWSQGIAQIDATFREAMEKVASYFITDVEIKAPSKADGSVISKEAKDKFDAFLRKTLLILTSLRRAALDYLIYGNSFISVLAPIRRKLSCPRCPGIIYPLKTVYENPKFGFRWDGAACTFNARCPKCGKTSAWVRHDEIQGPESAVVIKHWSVHEIDVREHRITGRKEFIWKIPDVFRRQVREGKLMELEDTPWEIIQAVQSNDNFRFARGVIYHMYEPPLCGFDAAGWGFSRALTNFRQAWHCQMLRRMNEAICQEFLIPFRIISPAARGGSDAASDPILGTNLMNFTAQMRAMILRHRRDPGQIQVSPVPVQYQIAGGEANQLAPYQLIEQATDALLNGSGVPAELYKGTLTLQAAPVGLRLFESRWRALVDQLNQLLDAVVDRVADLFSWEPVDAKLTKVTHADDLNRQMAKLQLMMGGQVSQTTGLRSVGMDFQTEQDQLMEEQEYVTKKTEEMAESRGGRQAMSQMNAMSGATPFAGQPPQQAGGQPAPAGGASGQGGQAPPVAGQVDPAQAGPQEIEDQGKQIASQLQGLPEEQRRSMLVQLKKQNPVLHSVVTQNLGDERQQAASQGQAQVLQAQYGKAAARLHRRWIPSTAELAVLVSRRKCG